jgi:hypothetical protein
MGKRKKFISFDRIPKNRESSKPTPEQEILALAINLSADSGRLLSIASESTIDMTELKTALEQLSENLEELRSKMPKERPIPSFLAITGTTQLDTTLFCDKVAERQLSNGGLAPPTIKDIKIDNFDKNNLIAEMRRMHRKNETITRSTLHHQTPFSIADFTEPFKYLENMHDYNGSFLVTLLKSELEIDSAAASFKIDLSEEKSFCQAGEALILQIYDIAGSPSKNEEKKFIVIISFDKLLGTLTYRYPQFQNGDKKSLSLRQKGELEKFFEKKKITI